MPTLPPRPLLVSFSGLDGAGKTTQILALQESLQQLRLSYATITFWDDIVVCASLRERFVHRVLGSERGVGSPAAPVARRDKNIRFAPLNLARYVLYLADALHSRGVIFRRARSGVAIILCDRWLYDELANLPLQSRLSSLYARLLARIAPRPDLALLLDVEPAFARARKPEYPVEFLHRSRRAYFLLARLLGTIAIVPPLELEDARRAVLASFLRLLHGKAKEADMAA